MKSMDTALADYLAWGCYQEAFGIAEGTNALWGATCIFTELLGRTPLAQRALKGWQRLAVTGEGGPIPWPGVMVLRETLLEMDEPIAADIVIVAADCYLRGHDWHLIQVRDVSSSGDKMGIQLGVPERGETTKTGTRQGVLPDFSLTKAIIQSNMEGKTPEQKLFDMTPAEFREIWSKACEKLHWYPGPPHSLRHCGPSYDASVAYRSLDAIRTRGRWRAKTSVLRYQKAHVLIAAEAAMPPELLARGRSLQDKLGKRAPKAL